MAETVREAGGDDPWVMASWYEGSVVVQGLAPERWRGRASVPEHSEGKADALREESDPDSGGAEEEPPASTSEATAGGRPLVMPPLVPLALLGFSQG